MVPVGGRGGAGLLLLRIGFECYPSLRGAGTPPALAPWREGALKETREAEGEDGERQCMRWWQHVTGRRRLAVCEAVLNDCPLDRHILVPLETPGKGMATEEEQVEQCNSEAKVVVVWCADHAGKRAPMKFGRCEVRNAYLT